MTQRVQQPTAQEIWADAAALQLRLAVRRHSGPDCNGFANLCVCTECKLHQRALDHLERRSSQDVRDFVNKYLRGRYAEWYPARFDYDGRIVFRRADEPHSPDFKLWPETDKDWADYSLERLCQIDPEASRLFWTKFAERGVLRMSEDDLATRRRQQARDQLAVNVRDAAAGASHDERRQLKIIVDAVNADEMKPADAADAIAALRQARLDRAA